MPFKKVKDNNFDNDIIDGDHNIFWVQNNKVENIRVINKIDEFYVVMFHKSYANNILQLRICSKDQIIGYDNCILCNDNKAVKTYITEILHLDYYFKPKQLKTKLWILPPYKYSDVFEKFDIKNSRINKDYNIKDYIFIIKRENNKYNLSYDQNFMLKHNFISAEEDNWINYLKTNYYDNI